MHMVWMLAHPLDRDLWNKCEWLRSYQTPDMADTWRSVAVENGKIPELHDPWRCTFHFETLGPRPRPSPSYFSDTIPYNYYCFSLINRHGRYSWWQEMRLKYSLLHLFLWYTVCVLCQLLKYIMKFSSGRYHKLKSSNTKILTTVLQLPFDRNP